MSGALIAHKGGMVKAGTVANVQETSMSDPALVGAHNAIIYIVIPANVQACSDSSSSSSTIDKLNTSIFHINIKDGMVDSIYGWYGGYKRAALINMTASLVIFDPSSGTISCGGTAIEQGIFQYRNGQTDTASWEIGRYDYVILD